MKPSECPDWFYQGAVVTGGAIILYHAVNEDDEMLRVVLRLPTGGQKVVPVKQFFASFGPEEPSEGERVRVPVPRAAEPLDLTG